MTTPTTTDATPTTTPKPQDETALQPAGPRSAVRISGAGLQPTTVDELWRLAQYAASSDIVPKDFRNKPYNVLIAAQHAMECGVPWLTGVQGTAIINGRPGFYGDLMLAVVISSPVYVKHVEYYEVKGERRAGLVADDWKNDETAAVCVCWRRGQEEPTMRRFNVGQAKKARLLTKEGPWTEYPDRQLQMRARAFALRDTFPDVLKGMTHSAEELRDLPPEPSSAAPDVVDREPRRLSETRHDFIDREADTRRAPDMVLIGPARVVKVEPFLNVFTFTLHDGTQIDAPEAADAMELEKCIGTDHQFRYKCTRGDDKRLQLVSFAIAD
jgi:hypothetical protein